MPMDAPATAWPAGKVRHVAASSDETGPSRCSMLTTDSGPPSSSRGNRLTGHGAAAPELQHIARLLCGRDFTTELADDARRSLDQLAVGRKHPTNQVPILLETDPHGPADQDQLSGDLDP